MIYSSKKHGGLVLAEVLIILGAVLIGESAIKLIGVSNFSFFIALPAILIGLVVRSHFSTIAGKNSEVFK